MVKESFVIGDRVMCGDHFGTVRYVGTVEGAKGWCVLIIVNYDL